MGISSDKTHPFYYPHPKIPNGETYRVSKAALNQIALQESIVYRETPLKVFAMCPGFVVSNLRGTSEEERTGWGMAGDAEVSGQTILSIIEGKRDADVGKFVHKDGVYPW
jgi:NAD(P)-dependent dehydrogenase (short-subunit alcohol dehydrogenase family)